MKIKSLFVYFIFISLILFFILCFSVWMLLGYMQNNQPSSAPNMASAVVVHTDASTIREIMLDMIKRKDNLQAHIAKLKEPRIGYDPSSNKNIIVEIYQVEKAKAEQEQRKKQALAELNQIVNEHISRYQHHVATLQAINTQNSHNLAMQKELLKRLESLILSGSVFLKTANTKDLTYWQEKHDFSLPKILPIRWRFESQFVRQPEILLEGAALLDLGNEVDIAIAWTHPPILGDDERFSERQRVEASILAFAANIQDCQKMAQDLAQLKLTRPEIKQSRDEYVALLQNNIQLSESIMQRLRMRADNIQIEPNKLWSQDQLEQEKIWFKQSNQDAQETVFNRLKQTVEQAY